MKKTILNTSFFLVLIIVFSSFTLVNFSCYGQKSSFKPSKNSGFSFDPDRLVYGGNLGFQFGDVTLLDVSPILGYKFTDKFVAGFGITYQYYEDRRFDPTFSTNIYGGSVFSRYYFMNDLFAHVEYEVLNYDGAFIDPYGGFATQRITANNIYIGAGYVMRMSENAGLNLLILYNINESAQSLYSNPIIRMGFTVGI